MLKNLSTLLVLLVQRIQLLRLVGLMKVTLVLVITLAQELIMMNRIPGDLAQSLLRALIEPGNNVRNIIEMIIVYEQLQKGPMLNLQYHHQNQHILHLLLDIPHRVLEWNKDRIIPIPLFLPHMFQLVHLNEDKLIQFLTVL